MFIWDPRLIVFHNDGMWAKVMALVKGGSMVR